MFSSSSSVQRSRFLVVAVAVAATALAAAVITHITSSGGAPTSATGEAVVEPYTPEPSAWNGVVAKQVELGTSGGGCTIDADAALSCWGSSWRPSAVIHDSYAPVHILSNAVQVSMDYHTACAVTTSSSVVCWGEDPYGQLGAGTTDHKEYAQPVVVKGVHDAAQVAVRDGFVCALLNTGKVWCWRNGSTGGGSDNKQGSLPTEVAGLSAVQQIAADEGLMCALLASGVVKCWNPGSSTPELLQIEGVTDATQISLGAYGGCATLSDKRVRCWGSGYWHLGYSDEVIIGPDQENVIDVQGLPEVSSVAVGQATSCALAVDETVWCWGQASTVGNGVVLDSSALQTTPRMVEGIQGVEQLSGGAARTCAVLDTGEVMCWGIYELQSRYDLPHRVSLSSKASAVSSGAETCAVENKGEVACWGGSFLVKFDPRQRSIDGLPGVRQISEGRSSACAATEEGRVFCWTTMELEEDPKKAVLEEIDTPEEVVGLREISHVSVGTENACASTLDGAVWCWENTTRTPKRVAGLPPVKLVSIGTHTACAATRTGDVWCWGENGFGQLGTGTTDSDNHPTPSLVPGLDSVDDIAAGDTVCAVKTDKSLWCWGGNSHTLRPLRVGGLPEVKKVRVRGDVTGYSSRVCAIDVKSQVWCWENDSENSSSPTPVTGLGPVKDVTIGTATCALEESGSVWCWGQNGFGHVEPTASFQPSPTRLVVPRAS